jgi:hypothetical protein
MGAGEAVDLAAKDSGRRGCAALELVGFCTEPGTESKRKQCHGIEWRRTYQAQTPLDVAH